MQSRNNRQPQTHRQNLLSAHLTAHAAAYTHMHVASSCARVHFDAAADTVPSPQPHIEPDPLPLAPLTYMLLMAPAPVGWPTPSQDATQRTQLITQLNRQASLSAFLYQLESVTPGCTAGKRDGTQRKVASMQSVSQMMLRQQEPLQTRFDTGCTLANC